MKPLYEMVECPFPGTTLYRPTKPGPCPGVLVLHGSEGGGFGSHHAESQFLAAHGYAALAFSYCGSVGAKVPGTPDAVINVELERTFAALRWLKAQVGEGKIALYGVSRGAEQALILATLSTKHPEVTKPDAVYAHAPSDVVWGSWSWSWVIGGWSLAWLFARGRPAWRWQGSAVEPGTRIEIERYQGPVLISHGEADGLWSVDLSRKIQTSREQAGQPVETLFLPGEDHMFSLAGENIRHQKLLEFFEKSLG